MNPSKRPKGFYPLLGAVILGGCFYFGKNDFEDIVQRSPEEWSTRDCLTVILGVMQHNFYDNESPVVKIVALPYYPSVVAAIERRAHILGPLQYQPFTYAHTSEMYRRRLDSALALEAGVFIDWAAGQFVDRHGNYLRNPTQLDLIMFYVSLQNTAWPGLTSGGYPDISHLEDSVFLENDQDELLKPRYVAGKRNSTLETEEKLIIMFPLKEQGPHFLSNSHEMRLVVKGFEKTIVLEFPISRMR